MHPPNQGRKSLILLMFVLCVCAVPILGPIIGRDRADIDHSIFRSRRGNLRPLSERLGSHGQLLEQYRSTTARMQLQRQDFTNQAHECGWVLLCLPGQIPSATNHVKGSRHHFLNVRPNLVRNSLARPTALARSTVRLKLRWLFPFWSRQLKLLSLKLIVATIAS
jgi:hypothetical protein